MRTYDELVQAMRGFQEARALLSAAELDVFNAAGDGARAAMMHTVNLWETWSTLTARVRTGTAARRPGADTLEAEWP